MKRRPGFTILELLTVMVIVGLLAAIALSRFWAVKERSYEAAVKSDLRTITVQQERYFSKNMMYATDPSDLPDVAMSPGVSLVVTWTSSDGWAGTAEHSSLSPKKCGYFTGPAPAGSAAPATTAGNIVCDP